MSRIVVEIADAAALSGWLLWCSCIAVVTLAGVVKRKDSTWAVAANTIGSNLHPFIPVAIVGDYLANVFLDGHMSIGQVVAMATGLAGWWLNRDTFDDRWKKRGKRLLEKVMQRGSKLVAVPVGGDAR